MDIEKAIHSAFTHYKKRNYPEAESICRGILANDPENAEAYFILGIISQSSQQFDDSIRYFQEVIRINPRHFGAHFHLGNALYNRRRLDEAAASLKTALMLNANLDAAYCDLGIIYREKGQFDKAIVYLRQALEMNPESAWAYTNLGVAMQNKGEFEEGKKFLRMAVEKNTRIQNTGQTFREMLVRDQKILRERMNLYKQGPKKILIVVTAFNRKKLTALALNQMRRYKTTYCHLQVYNDHSSEYDNTFLSDHADEVIQLPDKMGIDNLRWYQFRKFLETDFDFLYMTDNDVIHDPNYVDMLEELYVKGKEQLPVSLFSNIFMLQPRLILLCEEGVYVKTSSPGASMFFDRRMVETVVSVSDKIGNVLDDLPWDNKAVACLKLPWITPEQSYLEHFGAGGLHSDNHERERAINPTEYLHERRESILRYLSGKNDLRIDW
jgi:tetratricopeptide (TPR) repeat protein